MKLLALEITPKTPFGTYPKGDTLFGQIVSHFFLKGWKDFEEKDPPKLIVSDMMPQGYVYRPSLPSKCFGEMDKKELRKKKFIKLEDLHAGNLEKVSEVDFFKVVNNVKNSINRVTFSTEGKEFAPYGVVEYEFFRKMWLMMLVWEDIEEKVLDVLDEIGKFGFGKDISIGKGKFDFKPIDPPGFWQERSEWYMAISPVSLRGVRSASYEPFVRFGKFGLERAQKNAFKRPVMVADSGAVARFEEGREFFGEILENGNNRYRSYYQACSIAIPIKEPKCLSK